MNDKEHILEQLRKLDLRLKGKALALPGDACPAVDFHLAGLFLKTHMGLIIEAIKRLN